MALLVLGGRPNARSTVTAIGDTRARPPSGGEWTYEIKLDGYRILARIKGGSVRLFTRNGNDWTDKMPQPRRRPASQFAANELSPGGMMDATLHGCSLSATAICARSPRFTSVSMQNRTKRNSYSRRIGELQQHLR